MQMNSGVRDTPTELPGCSRGHAPNVKTKQNSVPNTVAMDTGMASGAAFPNKEPTLINMFDEQQEVFPDVLFRRGQ